MAIRSPGVAPGGQTGVSSTGGWSMKISRVPSERRSRSYSRVEASPLRGSRAAPARPLAARKPALWASRSGLKPSSFPGSVRDDPHKPAVVVVGNRNLYIESVVRQRPAKPFRPLDHRRPLVQGLVQPELIDLFSRGQAIEVEVGH